MTIVCRDANLEILGDINFWSQVKLASVDYMQQVQRMFVEKTELRARLLQTHGVRTVAW